MKQFVLDRTLNPQETITLKDDDFHYICRVRRCQLGDSIVVRDKNSSLFNVSLKEILNDSCRFHVDSKISSAERKYKIHLHLCLCKAKKNDIMIRQASEAGVNSISFLNSRYSQVKLESSQKEAVKWARWNKIIKEARQQSGSSINTELTTLGSFQDLPQMGGNHSGFFCHQEKLEDSSVQAIKQTDKEIHIVIGSEGGLAEEEIEILRQKGFSSLYLGNNVLRAETASIFAIAVIIAAMEIL